MQNIYSAISFIMKGGIMMYPLLLISVISMSLIVERLIFFGRIKDLDVSLLHRIKNMITNRGMEDLKALLSVQKTPVADVLATGTDHIDADISDMDIAMEQHALSIVPKLESKLWVLDTIITMAPLLGLLGTIIGMINAFQIFSSKGLNQPTGISGGVGEALIATATGLIVAVFTLVFYNYFNTRVRRIMKDMEFAANEFIKIVKQERK
ncbi:MAG: MotA/TolQ/ExbB proton channel family protein [Deltaproteobacteria bacterium]|nr:MotA/TolQ/ExbB proton channel family protein [Deltaproteobacteria bacterium]